jgi:NADH-quinone oxidoreductase subunit E
MLSPEEKRDIDELLAEVPHRRAAGIDALKVVQKRRGWISDEALRDVAAHLQLSVEDLEGVATFYSLIFRRPVGRHVILICDSVSCWVMGYEELLAALQQRLGIALGETTADGRFTLLSIPCLGACDRAPLLMIDEDLHGDLSPAKLDDILQGYE